MHRTNWDDLRYVLAVAEAGSVSAAARRLKVNHATVLRRVGQFEDAFGILVFDKEASGYAVTAEAQNIISAIRETEHAVFAVERLARGDRRGVRGTVRITSTDTICAYILPQIILDIRKEEPDLHLEVVSTNSYEDLAQSVVDIAIRPTPGLPSDMFGEPAGVLMFYAYQSVNERSTDLAWLGLRGNLARSKPALWMASNVEDREIIASADSFITLAEMVAKGVGRAYLPGFVGTQFENLEVIEDEISLSVDLWVASHQSLTKTPRIARVRELLTSRLAAHPAFG